MVLWVNASVGICIDFKVNVRISIGNSLEDNAFNPISYGLSDSVAPTGGGAFDIKKGVISDAMLLYSICLFVYLGVSPSQPANPQLGAEIALLSV